MTPTDRVTAAILYCEGAMDPLRWFTTTFAGTVAAACALSGWWSGALSCGAVTGGVYGTARFLKFLVALLRVIQERIAELEAQAARLARLDGTGGGDAP